MFITSKLYKKFQNLQKNVHDAFLQIRFCTVKTPYNQLMVYQTTFRPLLVWWCKIFIYNFFFFNQNESNMNTYLIAFDVFPNPQNQKHIFSSVIYLYPCHDLHFLGHILGIQWQIRLTVYVNEFLFYDLIKKKKNKKINVKS